MLVLLLHIYSLDESIDRNDSFKIIGHQWYIVSWIFWFFNQNTGEVLENLSFDSYMIPEDDLEKVIQLRLLEVKTELIYWVYKHIRLLVTSADVLQYLSIPSFGVKVDACPGRLSQASLFIEKEGVFMECSEICGINHGFMPIVVNAQNWFFF